MATDSQFHNLQECSDDFAFINEVQTPCRGQSPCVGYGLKIEDRSVSIDLHNHGSSEIGCLDDNESDSVFKVLSNILMEENTDEKQSMFHDPLALQATEKSFYDLIDKKYPPSPSISINTECPKSLCDRTCQSNGNLVDPPWSGDTGCSDSSVDQYRPPNQSIQSSVTSSQPLVHSENNSISNSGGQTDSFMNMHLVPSILSSSESMMYFRKGMEEAMKFLPTKTDLVIDLSKDHSSSTRRRKHLHSEDSNQDARSRKQSAVYEDEVEELSELLDKVLLRDVKGVTVSSKGYVKYLKGEDKYWQQNELPVLRNGKVPNKKQGTEINDVYLQSLLVSCAQAIASNDVQTAQEQLKEIRQCAPSTGDACQKTANIFANGLEARLAGTGTQMYADLASKRISAAEKLKGYEVYYSACPFIENSRVFANKMILKIAAKASTLHIVDFGISYGFQWPVLIQFLSIRERGPPKLRITGIDFPQAGFRPAILIEETGQHLAKCCKRFNVPFEYQAIARERWETIDISDLKLSRDEALVVNCLLGFHNLPEETVVVESPKDGVLKLIRTMKPDLFVHFIVNGSYGSPLFVHRFREAFFYYSSLFDMLHVTLPHNDLQRLHFETEFYGREVVNIIACEGQQRVVRPENYKQWQIRTREAGFEILPLDKEIVHFKGKVEASYHKDFLFVEDCNWMLQGWKGRVLYGTSCWVPV